MWTYGNMFMSQVCAEMGTVQQMQDRALRWYSTGPLSNSQMKKPPMNNQQFAMSLFTFPKNLRITNDKLTLRIAVDNIILLSSQNYHKTSSLSNNIT